MYMYNMLIVFHIIFFNVNSIQFTFICIALFTVHVVLKQFYSIQMY